MFDNLSERLNQSFKDLTGQGRITGDNIKNALRDVRMALLEADVALPVVKSFIDHVKEKSQGEKVISSVNPGQQFIKIVNDELVSIMGEANDSLNLAAQPPVVILMAGLQGAGKTTSSAKIARFLKEREKKKVMMVSADVYRPAAIEQLETLARDVEAAFFPSTQEQKPVDIAKAALDAARKQFCDVLILDTAGRLAIDQDMMDEISQLQKSINPTETLFVVDAMTGQDAANTAKAFNDVLDLTGVILTKADGDASGGAALSVRQITGKPIKFLGVGEKTDALEAFHPDRMAQRILGMGDVLTLVEEAERKLDKKKADRFARKVRKGGTLNFNDMLMQFQQMQNMGGVGSLLEKLPGMGQLAQVAQQQVNDKQMKHMEALILSMTKKERAKPDLISGSRKKRIAAGAGLGIPELNRLLKQQKMMAKMMKRMKGKGMARMMQGMSSMMGGGGGLPPGMGR